MTTNWDGYDAIEFPFGALQPREMTRAQARYFFDWMMAEREARIDQLRGLVKRNGYCVDSVDDFRRNAIAFVNSHAAAERDPIDIGHPIPASEADLFRPLTPIWAAVSVDVGLFVGSVIINEVPTLRWELLTKGGKLILGYHFPVLKGFENGPWADYYMSPITATHQSVTAAAIGKPMRPMDYWVDAARGFA